MSRYGIPPLRDFMEPNPVREVADRVAREVVELQEATIYSIMAAGVPASQIQLTTTTPQMIKSDLSTHIFCSWDIRFTTRT